MVTSASFAWVSNSSTKWKREHTAREEGEEALNPAAHEAMAWLPLVKLLEVEEYFFSSSSSSLSCTGLLSLSPSHNKSCGQRAQTQRGGNNCVHNHPKAVFVLLMIITGSLGSRTSMRCGILRAVAAAAAAMTIIVLLSLLFSRYDHINGSLSLSLFHCSLSFSFLNLTMQPANYSGALLFHEKQVKLSRSSVSGVSESSKIVIFPSYLSNEVRKREEKKMVKLAFSF